MSLYSISVHQVGSNTCDTVRATEQCSIFVGQVFVFSPSCCCVIWVVTERRWQGVWRHSERMMSLVIHEDLCFELPVCHDERNGICDSGFTYIENSH